MAKLAHQLWGTENVKEGKKNRGRQPRSKNVRGLCCILNIFSARGCVPLPRAGCLWHSRVWVHSTFCIMHSLAKPAKGRRQHILIYLIFHFIVVFWFVVQSVSPITDSHVIPNCKPSYLNFLWLTIIILSVLKWKTENRRGSSLTIHF